MHRRKIGTLLAVLMIGCYPTSQSVSLDPLSRLRSGPPVPLNSTWPLGRSGPAPADTTVIYSRRSGRRILLRQGAPDHSLFLLLDLPADSTAGPNDDMVLILRPVTDQYGVTLTSSTRLPRGASATFSYAMHFVQPPESRSRYPTPTRFDQQLSAVMTTDSLRVKFLETSRPASDLLTFPLTSSGTYFLAAPK